MSVDWDTLRCRSLRPGGFGDDRAQIWPQLLNAQSSISPSSSSSSEPHRDERQILLDTSRSFVLYPSTSATSYQEKELLQSELYELIVSLFRKRPKLNYFQGYHDIVSVMMLTLPKELQLICVEKLSLHWLRDSMGTGLEPVLGLLRVTKNLIKLADPELASMLEQSTQLPFFALSNLLTLFSHDTPTLPLIQHVFDYLLCRPPIAVVYLAAAIILVRKEEVRRLMEEDEEGMIHSLLSSLPALTDDLDPLSSTSRDISTTPTFTESLPDSLLTQPNGASTQPSPPSVSPSIDGTDTDTTVIADPELELLTAEETGTETDQSSLSPPPESDLTLVDSDPAEIITKDGIDEVDKTVTSTKDSPLPAHKPLINPKSSPAGKAEGSANDSREMECSKPPSLYEEVIDVDDATSGDNPKIVIRTTTPTSPNPKGSPTDESSSSHAQSSTAPTTNPSVSTSTESLTLSLSSLLARASYLQTLFPPSHPSLQLSRIMGPQSVVHTWSENFREWPSDNEAEGMVLRMDLIVYPFNPSAENDDDSEDQSETDEESYGEARQEKGEFQEKAQGRKRNKLTKSKPWKRHHRKQSSEKSHRHRPKSYLGANVMNFALKSLSQKGRKVERRTMLAGAVVVLGLAMAMYGAKGGGGSGSSGQGMFFV